MEKNQTNATSVILHPPREVIFFFLRIHLKIHSGEKEQKCNYCDFVCVQKGNLKRHIETHGGEKQNRCNQCQFSSYQKGNLRRHLKTHNKENKRQHP